MEPSLETLDKIKDGQKRFLSESILHAPDVPTALNTLLGTLDIKATLKLLKDNRIEVQVQSPNKAVTLRKLLLGLINTTGYNPEVYASDYLGEEALVSCRELNKNIHDCPPKEITHTYWCERILKQVADLASFGSRTPVVEIRLTHGFPKTAPITMPGKRAKRLVIPGREII